MQYELSYKTSMKGAIKWVNLIILNLLMSAILDATLQWHKHQSALRQTNQLSLH